jgi:Cu/Ag efflux protein CusF
MRLLCVTALVLSVGCGDKGRIDEYTVRGRITAMPEGERSKEIDVHHESIPTYKHRDGAVRGMDSMVMTFSPANDVALAGLEPGDPVEMTFEVRWDQRPALVIRRIQELPADTELKLGN